MRIAPYRLEMLHASRLSRRQGGFSLVELLVVIAILAIVALAGAPWFSKISQRNQIKSAARELSITLAAARMRAVKRNLPARVVVTPRSGSLVWNLVETFEQTLPTPIKVGEARLSPQIEFPPNPPTPYSVQAVVVTFGPDGRVQGVAPNTNSVFTLRGVKGASITNDLPVLVAANGKIEVLGPNPTLAKPKGTEWK